MNAGEEWPLATLPRRIAAAVIDVIILVVPYALLSMLHSALAILVLPLYGAVLESSPRRATWGKRLCGLEVRPAGGGRLTFMAALARNVLKYAGPYFAGSTFGLSVVAVAAPLALSKRRQGLHDLAAGSLVRHAPGQGISQLSVGVLATVVPLLFVAGVLPIVMNPAYEDAGRKELNRAIDATHPHRMRTAEFYAKNGKLPETLEEIGLQAPSPELAAFTFRNGRMDIELPRHRSRDPEQLTFTPQTSAAALTWRCTTVGIRKERLPAMCRSE